MFAEQISAETGRPLLEDVLAPEAKYPGERSGGGVLRSTLAVMVGRGCMACLAVKCRKKCRLGGWRRTRCLRESREKAIFS